MPTHLKIVLRNTYDGAVYTGKSAAKKLVAITQNNYHPFINAIKELGKTRRERYINLGQRLPPNWVLLIFQEPKNTRRKRSLAYKESRKEGQKIGLEHKNIPAIMAQLQQPPAPQFLQVAPPRQRPIVFDEPMDRDDF